MNIDEILEFKRIITTSNLSDEQIRRLGEILENIIKSVRADAIDELIEEIMKRPLVNYFQICEIVQIGKQLKEQKNE